MSTQAPSEVSEPTPVFEYDSAKPWKSFSTENPLDFGTLPNVLESPLDPEDWWQSWLRAKYLQEYISLLHCGLGTRDKVGHCPLLGFYLKLADGHSRKGDCDNRWDRLTPREKLSQMAFKMLCTRVFDEHGKNHMSAYIYRPEDVALVMYFFRNRDRIDDVPANYYGINPAQLAAIREFLPKFVVLHWISDLVTPALQQFNEFLRLNRHAALRMAYRIGVMDPLLDRTNWLFHNELDAGDATALRALIMDPDLNGWESPCMYQDLHEAMFRSHARRSASAAWYLMRTTKENHSKSRAKK